MADALKLELLKWGGFQPEPGAATNVSLDASNDGIGWVFDAVTADPITVVKFRYGLRTGTPPTYIVALESLDASGLPDGTVLGGASPASATFLPPADATWDGTLRAITLANAYTPTRGQRIVATVRHSSGTVDASNFSMFTRTLADLRSDAGGFPYGATLTAGTWAKSNTSPVFGYHTASNRYGYYCTGGYTTNTAGTATHRSAMHFTLPADYGNTFTVAGFEARYRNPATATQFKVFLRDASSELQAVTYDSDHFGAVSGTNSGRFMFDETTLSTLSCGTKYYIGFEVVGTAPVGMRGWQLGEADDRLQFPNGANRGLATDAGAGWVDDNTVMPMCNLILADWTEPSGGGVPRFGTSTPLWRGAA